MILHILKRDLKRKRSMNAILLLFITIAAMFVSSGVNNVIAIMNGTESYLRKSGVGDYNIITSKYTPEKLEKNKEILENCEAVKDYRIEECVSFVDSEVEIDGKESAEQSDFFMSIAKKKLKYYDMDNNEITDVKEGEIIVPVNLAKKEKIKKGDTIKLHAYDMEYEFRVAGESKDAFLGSSMVATSRFLICQRDYDKILSDKRVSDDNICLMMYIDTDDISAVESATSGIENKMLIADIDLIILSNIMEMIIAAIVLILSICLILVSFLMLKFSINFTINEEYREIGVMKAIGLKNVLIRGIYILKYFAISLVGAFAGFIASIPFGKMLLKTASRSMVLESGAGIAVNLISSVAVVLIIVGFSYFCTRKIKKASPIDAIREGQTGERFTRKSKLSLSKLRTKPVFFMALNDIVCSIKRYLTIIISFSLCMILVLTIVNTTETMRSDKLTYTLGKLSDVYLSTGSEVFNSTGKSEAKEIIMDKMAEYEKKLAENDMQCDISIECLLDYKVSCGEKECQTSLLQGINTKTTDYVYYEGTPPQNPNEVAITETVADKLGAEIGDTLIIDMGDEQREVIITAYIQNMIQIGNNIRVHEDFDADYSKMSMTMLYQVDFADDPDADEIEARKSEVKEITGVDKVYNKVEYTESCIGVADTLDGVKYLSLGISIIVIILVTILMERSFVSNEKNEIALLKATGFKDSSVVWWHVMRFVIIAVVSAVAASLLSIPVTKLCITPIWKMMGLKTVEYQFTLYKIFLLYPLIMTATALISAFGAARTTKRVKASDAASIE